MWKRAMVTWGMNKKRVMARETLIDEVNCRWLEMQGWDSLLRRVPHGEQRAFDESEVKMVCVRIELDVQSLMLRRVKRRPNSKRPGGSTIFCNARQQLATQS